MNKWMSEIKQKSHTPRRDRALEEEQNIELTYKIYQKIKTGVELTCFHKKR